jgi:hypothetical protein
LPLIVPANEEQEDSGEGEQDSGEQQQQQQQQQKQRLPKCGIRVGPTIQPWTTGKALVLDDSYEHEVWNNTNQERVLLLVDIWHPDVLPVERYNIVAMFQHAREQGWLDNN